MPPSVERYGIFRKFPDGSSIWVSAERDFKEAMQTMRDLAKADGMEYFVFDFREGLSVPMTPETDDTPPTR
jgi:hypothetical protein